MDLTLNEEQKALAESIERYLDDSYDFETRCKQLETDENFSAQQWAAFAELGWLAIPFPEELGGLGLGTEELAVLFEKFGRALVVEPYLPTVVLGGQILLSDSAKASALIPELVQGKLQLAVAFAEATSRFNLNSVATKAEKSGSDYVISGEKIVVFNAADADYIICVARTSGATDSDDGVTLFLVPGDTAGITRQDYRTVDGISASEVKFDQVKVSADAIIGKECEGAAVLESAIDYGLLAAGAEAVGCMEMINKDTLQYSKERTQFGIAIGTFQVLQHRMVDMFMEYEQTKSLMYMASVRLKEGNEVGAKATSALKAQVSKAGRYVGQQGVQIHGGMGVTDELRVGHYFKRLTTLEILFGNGDYHLKRFASK